MDAEERMARLRQIAVPTEDMIPGGAYLIDARNFDVGVWVPKNRVDPAFIQMNGFIGAREKFYNWSCFTEYDMLTVNGGSALALEYLNADVPPGITLSDYLLDEDDNIFANTALLEWLRDLEASFGDNRYWAERRSAVIKERRRAAQND